MVSALERVEWTPQCIDVQWLCWSSTPIHAHSVKGHVHHHHIIEYVMILHYITVSDVKWAKHEDEMHYQYWQWIMLILHSFKGGLYISTGSIYSPISVNRQWVDCVSQSVSRHALDGLCTWVGRQWVGCVPE